MDVAVLGTTEAGRTVTRRCVRAGHTVTLCGADANAVMDAIDAIERADGPDAVEAVNGTTDREAAVDGAEVVVEATDDASADRRERLAAVEESADDGALVAACARHGSVTAVAAGLRRPGRAVGLHLVDDGVVEVIVADQTTDGTRERAVEFVAGLDVTPLVVRDAPGFASARLELATIAEAIRLVEDGVAAIPDVDRTMEVGRGHPRGPLALADRLGLEDVLAGLEDLTDRLDGRFAPPGLLREKVAAGDLGRATGRGFYVWESGERTEPADPNPQVEARTDAPADPGER